MQEKKAVINPIAFGYGNNLRSLRMIGVCPQCGCRIVKHIKQDTFSYHLCYGCGWSSMTPQEIGRAMAKESCSKLTLNLSL